VRADDKVTIGQGDKVKFSLHILTCDRSVAGSRNYLGQTLQSLQAGGVPFDAVHLWDSGTTIGSWEIGDGRWFPGLAQLPSANSHLPTHLPTPICHLPPSRLTQNQNLIRALRHAATLDSEFTLILEDDIEVCERFAAVLEDWTERFFRHSPCRLASLYTPYDEVRVAWERSPRLGRWAYPVSAFYALCCVMLRTRDCAGLADTLERVTGPGGEAEGRAKEADLWVALHFQGERVLASVPCLAQHVGDESVANPGAPQRRASGFVKSVIGDR